MLSRKQKGRKQGRRLFALTSERLNLMRRAAHFPSECTRETQVPGSLSTALMSNFHYVMAENPVVEAIRTPSDDGNPVVEAKTLPMSFGPDLGLWVWSKPLLFSTASCELCCLKTCCCARGLGAQGRLFVVN